jgi:hypothetical protein
MRRRRQTSKTKGVDSGRPARARRVKRSVEDERTLLALELSLSWRCAWCLEPISGDVEAKGVFAIIDETDGGDEPGLVAFIQIPDRLIHGLRIDYREDGRNVGCMVCSDECLETLSEAMSAGPAGDLPPAPATRGTPNRKPPRPATPARSAVRRRWACELLDGHCAWCRKEVGEDEPVIGLLAGLRKRPARPIKDEMTSVELAGRHVHGRISEPGSKVALDGFDIVFMVCSEKCADALRAAARKEQQRPAIH